MDDEQKRVMIIVCGAAFLVFFAGMLLFRPARKTDRPESFTGKSGIDQKQQQNSSFQDHSPAQITRAPAPRLDLTFKEAEKAREEHEKAIRAGAEKWLKEFTSNTNISTLTRDLYTVRNNPTIQAGVYYLHEGNDIQAATEFEKAAADESNPLSVRFVAIRQRFFISRNFKDPDDYFKWGKMLGEMMKNHNFSHFDIEQSDEFLEKIKYQEIYYKARNNKSMQDAIVSYLLNEQRGYDQQLAQEEVMRRIKEVEKELQG